MRRSPFFLLLLLFTAGCATSTRALPAADASDEHVFEYVSRVESAESKAFYYFLEADLKARDGDAEGAAESLIRALEYDPRSASLRLALARTYLQLGDEKNAVRTAEDALIQDPTLWQVHLMLGNYYFERGNDDKAVVHFREVVARNPELESAYLHLGIALARSGAMDEAVDSVKALLARNPDSLVGELALARMYREIGLTVRAEESYRRILARHPDFEPATLELAEIYLDGKRMQDALALYREALERDPGNALVRHQLVRIFIEQDRLDAALAQLKEILRLNPEDMDARRKIGLIHLEKENWTAAVEVFSAILATQPRPHSERWKVEFYLATALERRGDWPQALELFLDLPPESDHYEDALSHAGYLLYQLGRTQEAVTLLQGYLDETVGRPQLYIYLASLYVGLDRHDAAISVLEQGMQAYEEEAEFPYQKALVLEGMKRSTQAVAAAEQALRLDPDHVEALNFLAYSWAERGENLDAALRMAQRALALRDEAHIVDTLGWIYFKLRRYEEAHNALARAVDMLPHDPLVLEHFADVLHALRRDRQAGDIYRQVIEMSGSETARRKLDRLREEKR